MIAYQPEKQGNISFANKLFKSIFGKTESGILTVRDCARANFAIGALSFFSAIILLLFFPEVIQNAPFPGGLVDKQIYLGIFLMVGWPLSKFSESKAKFVLAIDGLIFCLVVIYIFLLMPEMMNNLLGLNTKGEKISIGYAPGISAFLFGYGMWQFINFFLKKYIDDYLSRSIPILFFFIGLGIDIYLTYLFIRFFLEMINVFSG